jgi:hypothetical protein
MDLKSKQQGNDSDRGNPDQYLILTLLFNSSPIQGRGFRKIIAVNLCSAHRLFSINDNH